MSAKKRIKKVSEASSAIPEAAVEVLSTEPVAEELVTEQEQIQEPEVSEEIVTEQEQPQEQGTVTEQAVEATADPVSAACAQCLNSTRVRKIRAFYGMWSTLPYVVEDCRKKIMAGLLQGKLVVQPVLDPTPVVYDIVATPETIAQCKETRKGIRFVWNEYLEK